MVGDSLAIRRAYQTGRLNAGDGGLTTTAIVDVRSYVDGPPPPPFDALKDVDVHDGYHSLVMRARLLKYNGNAGNHVMLLSASSGRVQTDTRTVGSPLTKMNGEALAQLDQWLTAVVNDKSDTPLARKIAAHKPADLADACWPAVAGPLVGAVEKVTDMERCKKLFPYAGDARLAAGGSASDDVLKCTLKPVDPADYKTRPTAEQLAQLRQNFPEGVCDYSKPGMEQARIAGTWAVFKGDGEFVMLEPRR
jgi:hypothetical protein